MKQVEHTTLGKLMYQINDNKDEDIMLILTKEQCQEVIKGYMGIKENYENMEKAIEILKEKVHLELLEPKDEEEMKKCLEANEEPYLIIIGEEWFTLNDKNKFDLLKEVLDSE